MYLSGSWVAGPQKAKSKNKQLQWVSDAFNLCVPANLSQTATPPLWRLPTRDQVAFLSNSSWEFECTMPTSASNLLPPIPAALQHALGWCEVMLGVQWTLLASGATLPHGRLGCSHLWKRSPYSSRAVRTWDVKRIWPSDMLSSVDVIKFRTEHST